jgi:hypothetical protein
VKVEETALDLDHYTAILTKKEQLTELLKAMQEKMDANQAKTDINLKEMKEEMLAKMEVRIEANNKKFEVLQGTLISWLDAHHAKTEANHEELMAAMKASHERMIAKMEANPEEMKSVVVHDEVPKEEATVKTVRALKKRHGVQHLAVGRLRKPKERTQGKGGSQRKLATARRGMTHHAGEA